MLLFLLLSLPWWVTVEHVGQVAGWHPTVKLFNLTTVDLLESRLPLMLKVHDSVLASRYAPVLPRYSYAKLLYSRDGRLRKHDVFAVQAWRVPHPPVRGHRLCATQPLVHKGFLKCWQAGGFNHKVIKRIMELVQSSKPGSDKLKIYVTGAALIHKPLETCIVCQTLELCCRNLKTQSDTMTTGTKERPSRLLLHHIFGDF